MLGLEGPQAPWVLFFLLYGAQALATHATREGSPIRAPCLTQRLKLPCQLWARGAPLLWAGHSAHTTPSPSRGSSWGHAAAEGQPGDQTQTANPEGWGAASPHGLAGRKWEAAGPHASPMRLLLPPRDSRRTLSPFWASVSLLSPPIGFQAPKGPSGPDTDKSRRAAASGWGVHTVSCLPAERPTLPHGPQARGPLGCHGSIHHAP